LQYHFILIYTLFPCFLNYVWDSHVHFSDFEWHFFFAHMIKQFWVTYTKNVKVLLI
jgi:hypothetical protein